MLPKIKIILYATGLGTGAPYVCRYALAIAEQHNAQITALHVTEPLSPFAQSLVELHISHAQNEQIHAGARDQIRKETEQKLSELLAAETGRSGITNSRFSDVKVVDGQPAQTILSEARRIKADLIVIGSHRHGAIGSALLGHTANKLSQLSEIPLMLIRIPEEFV